MITLILISVVVVLVTFLLVRSIRRLQLFKRRGINHHKPLPIFGNAFRNIIMQRNFFDLVADVCKDYPKDPILGFYAFNEPFNIIQDLNYVENILIKDFGYFMDRGLENADDSSDPLESHLFLLSGNKWRAVRQKLSPIFTSGKLKFMYLSMAECGESLITYLEKVDLKKVDLREATSLLFTDMVGSAVFGIDSKTILNPDSEFRKMGKKLFTFGLKDLLKQFILTTFPKLARKLGLSFFKKDVMEYFAKVSSDTFNHRKKTGAYRNDFVQMMIQLQEKGTIEIQNWDKNDDYLMYDEQNINETIELSEEVLHAQGATFLIAGIDMLSLASLYTFYELSVNPKIQERARDEVQMQIAKHSGLTYDALRNMPYIENILKEAQRLHPTALLLIRKCTKDYTFPNGYSVSKGESFIIPLNIIHRNPDYFPEPESFRPERFEGQSRNTAYLPFGDGPRMCIAMRFAILELKFCVALLLSKYKMALNPETKLPIQIKPTAGLLIPKDDLIFTFEKI